jgi:hypothetical protein
MEKTVKLSKPVDVSLTLGKKNVTEVSTSPLVIQKMKQTTTKEVDGETITSTKTITQASWVARGDGGTPHQGVQIKVTLPDDLAAAIEKFHDQATDAAVQAAD